MLLPSHFILSGAISNCLLRLLSSMLDTFKPGGLIFWCPVFLLFHTVHGILQVRILAQVSISYSNEPCFVRILPYVLCIIGDWNSKVGSQEITRVMGKFGLGVQNEAGQRLTEFCQENALVIANTLFQQHKRRLYTWTSPDGQYHNQIDYILCSQRWRSSIQSTTTKKTGS